MGWFEELVARARPHIVEVVCYCPDPDLCATSDLVAHRDTAWKEYFRLREQLERLHLKGVDV